MLPGDSLAQQRVGHDFDCRSAFKRHRREERFVQLVRAFDSNAKTGAGCHVLSDVRIAEPGLPGVPIAGTLRCRDLAECVVVEQEVGDVV